ncbi:prepilin-type N-terminal cleavage/methylation domain-containing protein [Planococcus sp. SIMBA_143]
MKKFLQKKLKDQKGMTLIELLAVIVIIAIIAAIAIPAIGNLIENSRVGAMKSDALNAMSAAELYLADNPTQTSVSAIGDLTGYLDDRGSLTAFTYTPAVGTTAATMTGTTEVSSIKIVFAAGTTKANITALPNNTGNATVGTITVSGR